MKFQPKGSPIAINAAVYEFKESNLVVSADTFTNSLIGAATRTRGFELEVIRRSRRDSAGDGGLPCGTCPTIPMRWMLPVRSRARWGRLLR